MEINKKHKSPFELPARMANSGDKFASLVIPNCQRTIAQEEKLQSCPNFVRETSDDTPIQSLSSSPEQPTGVQMVSLPDSFDEYQTPPEQPYSQNSSNDGHVAPTKTPAFDGEPRIVDLADVSDNLDTEPMDVDDRVDEKMVAEDVDTEVVGTGEENANTHQVFDEMPNREPETSKRKLPILMQKKKQNSNVTNIGSFKETLSRVMKMVGEGKTRAGGDKDSDVDFMEIAKMRGMTFPRPRWWPAEGFKDSSSSS